MTVDGVNYTDAGSGTGGGVCSCLKGVVESDRLHGRSLTGLIKRNGEMAGRQARHSRTGRGWQGRRGASASLSLPDMNTMVDRSC
jgi:hypothetical protein